MRIRHVVDESGLRLDGLSGEAAAEVVDGFLARVDAARDRSEAIYRSRSDVYSAPVRAGLSMFEFLYESARSPIEDPDRRRRLQIALDRAQIWEEDDELDDLLVGLDVEIDGEQVSAPSVALAHACRQVPRAVGCLNFRSPARRGVAEVKVGNETHELHFVVDAPTHVQLFRDAVAIENMDESGFEANANSAFPSLTWADRVWSGLRKFERPYREHRRALVQHLGVLNDDGAELFDELMSMHPEQIAGRLDALGVEATDENGRTKQDKRARAERVRTLEGRDEVFWWHTKLLRHVDRIHFLWRGGVLGERGTISIGLFRDHCHIPG